VIAREPQRLLATFQIKDMYGTPYYVNVWSDDTSEFAKLLRMLLRQGIRLHVDRLELIYQAGWDVPQ
jgi:hypothetical protein